MLEVSGIDFNRFFEDGIEVEDFAEHFMSSGIVLNENVNWVTFHGTYDFAYLLRLLTNQLLPENEETFDDNLSLYFPHYYDVRQMVNNLPFLKGSLSKIARDLDITRVGHTHQAGSDSLVTSKVFFKLLHIYGDQLDMVGDANKLFGFTKRITDEMDYVNGTVYTGGYNMYNTSNPYRQNLVYYNPINVNCNPLIYQNMSNTSGINNFSPTSMSMEYNNYYNSFYRK